MSRYLIVAAAGATLAACTTAMAGPEDSRSQRLTDVPLIEPATSGVRAMRKFVERFPGATLLGEAEFAEAILGHSFRYRAVGSELVIERPGEFFFEDGRYSVGDRPIWEGTYSFKGGVVSIDCPQTFMGLGRERIFFRHEGRLLTASASGGGAVVELIPSS